MSFAGLTPPLTFLQTPGQPPILWNQWKSLFFTYLEASRASDISLQRRKAILLHSLGVAGRATPVQQRPCSLNYTCTACTDCGRHIWREQLGDVHRGGQPVEEQVLGEDRSRPLPRRSTREQRPPAWLQEFAKK
ncbi:hypothetical protein HPB47_020856 [Ixodes persulcatus]|uniref:Uncharacterized protein n=1 Tax=Ixodes persulcatus TaxID=34615 RepID=A0AC60QHS2_IXOPE|nr:hypothetical protein HPB47_020856 [Ixodes persulcatus]